VPKQNASGGKDKLGSISKQGDRYLRSLFTAGALAVIRYAKTTGHRPWLTIVQSPEQPPISRALPLGSPYEYPTAEPLAPGGTSQLRP
jgi:hypothetical protein